MPARPGAFTANFAPETLNDFRETCKRSGLQYTKVLEELANGYLAQEETVIRCPDPGKLYVSMMTRHTETIRRIFDHLESKNLLDKETKRELTLIVESSKTVNLDDLTKVEPSEKDGAPENQSSARSSKFSTSPEKSTNRQEDIHNLNEKMQLFESQREDLVRQLENMKEQLAAIGKKIEI